MILSNAELVKLSGRHRPSAIMRWLDSERIPYLVGADGWPRLAGTLLDTKEPPISLYPAPDPGFRRLQTQQRNARD